MDRCALSEDVTQQTVSTPDLDPVHRDPSYWLYYHKPIFMLIAGGLALAAGFVIILNSSGLLTSNFTDTMPVDDEMGPLCLSVGLMFAVFGVVWTLIIKEHVKHKSTLVFCPDKLQSSDTIQ